MINRKLYDLIYNSKDDIFRRNVVISSGYSHQLIFQHHINRSITITLRVNNIDFKAKFNSYEQLRLQFDKKKDFAMLTFLTLMFIMSKKFGFQSRFSCKYLDNYPEQKNQREDIIRAVTTTLSEIRPVWTTNQPNYIRGETLTTINSERMNNIESELGRLRDAINIFSESLNGEFRRRFEALNEREN